MTSVQPEFNPTAAQPESKSTSSVQPHFDLQKQLSLTEQKADYAKEPTQAVMNKLRKFIDKIDREQALEESLQEAVHNEVAKLVVILQKVENLLLCEGRKRQEMKAKLKGLIDDVDIALQALDQPKPKISLAKKIRVSVERIVYRYQYPFPIWLATNRFHDAYESESTPLKVLYGLSAALSINIVLIVGTGALIYFQSLLDVRRSPEARSTSSETQISEQQDEVQDLTDKIVGIAADRSSQPYSEQRLTNLTGRLENAQSRLRELNREQLAPAPIRKNIRHLREVILVITAGTMGSIISILIRIEDFQDKKYWDRATPFLIGAFKPIIGASFAIFFFTLISSELIQIPGINTGIDISSESLDAEERRVLSQIDTLDESREEFFIFAIAFLVGFSERLATDAISKVEDMVGSDSQKSKKDEEHKDEAKN